VVKGGAGHGFKAPSLKQISPDYREDEGPNTYFGNAALRPERSDAAEIGVAWDQADFGVQAMAFASRVEDLIVPRLLRQVGSRGEYLFENIDSARFKGVEAALAWRFAAIRFQTCSLFAPFSASAGDPGMRRGPLVTPRPPAVGSAC